MKKQYAIPQMDLISVRAEDVLTASIQHQAQGQGDVVSWLGTPSL